MKHSPTGEYTEGSHKTWRIEDVPKQVVEIALQAANLIGDGFYGVDLKETEKGVVVMEINDNPNIDTGVEDKILGDDLYRMIIQEFVRRLDLMMSL
jgi:glutathione synthase/RimK-type ligase-like ATP-grasp enzyme